MPQWRESQHWYLGLTGSQIGDLFLKDRTREGVDSYWSKWCKWEQSACESSFNLWHVEKNKLLTVSPGNHAIMQEGGTASICMHPTCNATRMVLKGWSPPPIQSVRTVTVSFLWIMQHLHHGTVFNASPVHPVFLCFLFVFFTKFATCKLWFTTDFLQDSQLYLRSASFC